LTSLTLANIAAGVAGIFSAAESSTREPDDDVNSERAPYTALKGSNAAAPMPQSNAPSSRLR
jgi:hypothetical protein